jgi:hypothetical protein
MGSSGQNANDPRQRIGINRSVDRQLHTRRQFDPDLAARLRGRRQSRE